MAHFFGWLDANEEKHAEPFYLCGKKENSKISHALIPFTTQHQRDRTHNMHRMAKGKGERASERERIHMQNASKTATVAHQLHTIMRTVDIPRAHMMTSFIRFIGFTKAPTKRKIENQTSSVFLLHLLPLFPSLVALYLCRFFRDFRSDFLESTPAINSFFFSFFLFAHTRELHYARDKCTHALLVHRLTGELKTYHLSRTTMAMVATMTAGQRHVAIADDDGVPLCARN